MRWCWVSLPHATFGVGVHGGVVVEVAPVAGWALGKPWATCSAYWVRKGARFAEVFPDRAS